MVRRVALYGWLMAGLACVGPAPVQVAVAEAEAGPRSGLELRYFDRSVRPADNLYRFVNGKWLDSFVIPADKSNYGQFTKLYDGAQENLRAIILDAPQSGEGGGARLIGEAYGAFMDREGIERAGLGPLREELARIDGISSLEGLLAAMGRLVRWGVKVPLYLWVSLDATDTTRYAVYAHQSGLGLPDRDYYLKDEAKFRAIVEEYRRYVADSLTLLGHPDPVTSAEAVVTLEATLAKGHWTRVQNRDPARTYNPFPVKELSGLCEACQWSAFLQGAGLEAVERVIVRQPAFVSSFGEVLLKQPVSVWRDYLKVRLLSALAPRLPRAFVDLHFKFYQGRLRGVLEQPPLWKRAVNEVESMLGEAVGERYVRRHFKPEAKRRMEVIVGHVVEAFREGLLELDWMSEETRGEALDKLSRLRTKIGYPEKWEDYSGLEIRPGDAAGNWLRATEFEFQKNIDKLKEPVDRDEWHMTPQTVNAYYSASMNEVVFPAAILAPPFFNPAAEDAVNYGAIGAVIGHELSHGFDDKGRKSDGEGNLRDWWSAGDSEEFEARARLLVKQYDSYAPLKGGRVNGELTLGENIGDLGGLTTAYRAYQLSLGGRASPHLDGFSGEQRFFLGWAQVWARKYREDELRRRLLTDSHAPSEFRVSGVVSNMPEFYRAFDVKAGDRLFREKDARVKIW